MNQLAARLAALQRQLEQTVPARRPAPHFCAEDGRPCDRPGLHIVIEPCEGDDA